MSARQPGRPLERTPRGAATREKLITAARQVMLTIGPLGLTQRAVAAKAGVALSNLQFHFSSTEALLGALLNAELERGAAFVERSIAEASGDPIDAAIDALLSFQLEKETAQLFFSMWAVATTSVTVREALHRFYSDWIGRVAEFRHPEREPTGAHADQAWLFVALLEGASLFRCGVAGGVTPGREAALRRALSGMIIS